MTARPLLRHTVGELEELFTQKSADTETLNALAAELRYRSVPRATALLRKVKVALTGGSPLLHQAQSADFAPPSIRPAQPTSTLISPVPEAQRAIIVPKTMPAPLMASSDPPPMSLDDAFKVLRVTSTVPWAEVEQARVKMVQSAHPDAIAGLSSEKRATLQAEAKRANAAYASIAASRRNEAV
jgi:DnaJ-domain-containing protein 1